MQQCGHVMKCNQDRLTFLNYVHQCTYLIMRHVVVTYINTMGRIVIRRQDGRGRFSEYRTASPNADKVTKKIPTENFYMILHHMNIYKQYKETNKKCMYILYTKSVHLAAPRTEIASEMH